MSCRALSPDTPACSATGIRQSSTSQELSSWILIASIPPTDRFDQPTTYPLELDLRPVAAHPAHAAVVFVRGLVVHGVVEDASMVAVALNLAKQRHPTRHTQIQPAPLFRPRFNDANLGRMQLSHRPSLGPDLHTSVRDLLWTHRVCMENSLIDGLRSSRCGVTWSSLSVPVIMGRTVDDVMAGVMMSSIRSGATTTKPWLFT